MGLASSLALTNTYTSTQAGLMPLKCASPFSVSTSSWPLCPSPLSSTHASRRLLSPLRLHSDISEMLSSCIICARSYAGITTVVATALPHTCESLLHGRAVCVGRCVPSLAHVNAPPQPRSLPLSACHLPHFPHYPPHICPVKLLTLLLLPHNTHAFPSLALLSRLFLRSSSHQCVLQSLCLDRLAT